MKAGLAVIKALDKAANSCGGTPPSFGPPSMTEHTSFAISTSLLLLDDLFGPDPSLTFSNESALHSCQLTVLDSVRKCQNARLKDFEKCKVKGMKTGTITNAATLHSDCIGTGPDVVADETCDDGGTDDGDGCSATGQVEEGYTCAGGPSVCTAISGDGLIRGAEACDDTNTGSGDGCNAVCQIDRLGVQR